VPGYVLDYILYHEMLHMQLATASRDARHVIHSAEFRAAERRFPFVNDAFDWLDANLGEKESPSEVHTRRS
ncbi:MAG TPA: hypothetical protein VFY29_10935, partial [Terriglobia bacterium]|nr:hypothetical protein [Terriglobia bacterium]